MCAGRCQTSRFTSRYRNTYPAAIDLLADGAVDAAGLADFEMELERVGEAFERATDPETVKGMVTLGK